MKTVTLVFNQNAAQRVAAMLYEGQFQPVLCYSKEDFFDLKIIAVLILTAEEVERFSKSELLNFSKP